jgi:DNA-binding response OmpR family regulator
MVYIFKMQEGCDKMVNILLVEDDFALSMGIEFALGGSGFEGFCAKSLKEAKGSFLNSLDLVLLDVMLPDGSGYEFCKYVSK